MRWLVLMALAVFVVGCGDISEIGKKDENGEKRERPADMNDAMDPLF